MSTSGAVEPDSPAHLVLVHDGAGVAVGEPVLVGQPVRALFAAQECRTGFEACEPLREGSSGDGRDARDQVLVRFQGVVQSQLAPPEGGLLLLLRLHHARAPGNPPEPTLSKRGGALRDPAGRLAVAWAGSAGKRPVTSTAARPRRNERGWRGCGRARGVR